MSGFQGQHAIDAGHQGERVSLTPDPSNFPARSELSQMNVIALLEAALREKDDIIQAQYVELASTRERLALAVRMLNEANGRVSKHHREPTSSNLGHG
jgi:hypothetical protein